MTREETVRLLRRDNWGAVWPAPFKARRKPGAHAQSRLAGIRRRRAPRAPASPA